MWWLIFGGAAVLVIRLIRHRGTERKLRLPSFRRKKKNGDNGGEN
jgi:hypothetical protein